MFLVLVFILCALSFGVYPIIGAGWSSNSKFPLLGGLRAVAQTISYEIRLALTLLRLVIIYGSFSWGRFLPLPSVGVVLLRRPLALIWLISSLAEANRTPFDFAEGESELVSGFNTEFSARGFALFFLAEYSRIIFLRLLFRVLFLNSNKGPLWGAFLIMFAFLWARGTLPRLRYDKLIGLAWELFLPLALFYLLLFLGLSLIP